MTEDLTTFTEIDGTISKTADRVTVVNIARNGNSKLYKSYGPGHFTDFVHELEYRVSANQIYAWWIPWGVAEGIGNVVTAACGREYLVAGRCSADSSKTMLVLHEYHDGGGVGGDGTDPDLLAFNTTYYLTITKSGTDLKCEIYDDPAKGLGDLLDTLNLIVTDEATEYLYATQVYGSGAARLMSGYAQYYDLNESTPGSADLFAKTEVRQSGSQDLSAETEVRHPAVQDLFGEFEIQDSADLFAEFETRQFGSQDLFTELEIKNIGTAALFAEFEIQDSEDLFAEFEARQFGSQGLFAELEVRNIGAAVLFAEFEIQDSEDLFAEFAMRHSASQNLFAEFIIKQESSQILFAKFKIIHTGSPEILFAEFVVRQTSFQDIFAEVNIIHWKDLFAKVIIRHTALQNLFAEFVVQHTGAPRSLKGFFVGVFPSKELFSEFAVRHGNFEEFKAEGWIKNPRASRFAKFEVRHSAIGSVYTRTFIIHSLSSDLKAILNVRNSSSRNLFAEFFPVNNASSILKGSFTPQRGDWANLLCYFKIRRASYDVLVPDTFAWINYVAGLGSAFVERPSLVSESIEGINGACLQSVVSSHRHEGIRFGWVATREWAFDERIYQSLKELKAEFYVMVDILPTDMWSDPSIGQGWWDEHFGLYTQMRPTDDYTEVAAENPYPVRSDLGGPYIGFGTYKKYQEGIFVWEASVLNPQPDSGVETGCPIILGGLSSVRIPLSGADEDLAIVLYNPTLDRLEFGCKLVGVATTVTLPAGIDPEVRHTYKLHLESPASSPPNGRARLWVDDVLEATVTSNVPTRWMSWIVWVLANYIDAETRTGVRLYTFSPP